MTRETAIEILKELWRTKYPLYLESDIRKALEMAIQSLEQEPCEDAISRKVLISHIENQSREWGEDYDVQQILGDIEDMPSVKPQENTGHWIGIDEEPHEVWECDHCGFVIDGSGCIDPYDYRDTYKYCPYCGARMVDEQESEVQDADSN